MKLSILPIFVLLFLAACHKPKTRKNEITKIEVATGGCLGRCPVTAINIDSSLAYNYFGGYDAKLKGCYTGKITQSYWDSLNVQLSRVDFRKLEKSPEWTIDGEMAEVVCYQLKVKHHLFISIYANDSIDYKSKLFREIAYSYEHVQLHKMKDTIKFETKFQNIKPPILKKDQVKFPPPSYRYPINR